MVIHVIISGPNPSVLSVFFIKVCEMESKAFLKSIRSISADFFSLIVEVNYVNDAAAYIVVFYVCLLLPTDY